MDVSTHLEIAKIVKKAVEEQFPIKLDTTGFYYGAIKPDISPELVKILHYKKDSFNYIKQEIKKLWETKPIGTMKYSRHLSERLGVIMHYITDYFCYVHSDHYQGSMFLHCLYELELAVYCKVKARKLKINNDCGKSNILRNYNDLGHYIEKLHCEYMSKKPGKGLDISFALQACITLCLSMISAAFNTGKSPVQFRQLNEDCLPGLVKKLG